MLEKLILVPAQLGNLDDSTKQMEQKNTWELTCGGAYTYKPLGCLLFVSDCVLQHFCCVFFNVLFVFVCLFKNFVRERSLKSYK